MDPGKPTKTLADYLVIIVSPVLIMVMVHSVCFFLVDVFYRGEAIGGVRWVLFWFVVAVVGIARIGIEQGDTQAMVYGLFLAGVTWMYLSFAHLNPALGALLLGIVWFTAHKITCNCTLVDDDVDASGQGLLQSIRKLPRWLKKGRLDEPQEEPQPAPAAKVGGIPAPLRTKAPVEKKAKSSVSQIPGIWLLYFGLAALLIFGLGQPLLPAGDVAARHRGFIYLFCYLAAALGLLINTSFLGLRRYLRQRYLVMPVNIAVGWIQYGIIGAAVVLCLAVLLPRPGAGEAWGALRYHVNNQLRRASDYAMRFNPHGSGSGRAGNQIPPAGQPENNPSQPGQSPGQSQNEDQGAKRQGEQQSGSQSDHGAPAGKSGGENPGKTMPSLTPEAGSLYPWLKALFYLAAVIFLGWLIYRYRVVIAMALRSLWAAIRNFIAALFGRLKPAAPVTAQKPRQVPAFKTFKNPFLTGGDQIWPVEDLIAYSYEALQSWASENEAASGSPQTPRELCRQLAAEIPGAADALTHLAYVFGHVAYGGSVPPNFNREHLRLLWDYMASPRVKQPEALNIR